MVLFYIFIKTIDSEVKYFKYKICVKFIPGSVSIFIRKRKSASDVQTRNPLSCTVYGNTSVPLMAMQRDQL